MSVVESKNYFDWKTFLRKKMLTLEHVHSDLQVKYMCHEMLCKVQLYTVAELGQVWILHSRTDEVQFNIWHNKRIWQEFKWPLFYSVFLNCSCQNLKNQPEPFFNDKALCGIISKWFIHLYTRNYSDIRKCLFLVSFMPLFPKQFKSQSLKINHSLHVVVRHIVLLCQESNSF